MTRDELQRKRRIGRFFLLALTSSLLISAVSAQTKRLTEDEAWELVRQAYYAYFRDGKDPDRAILLLQRVLASYPEGFRATSPKNRDELIRKGDAAALERALQEVGDERFDLDVDGCLTEIYYAAKKDFRKAAYYAERAMKRSPNSQRGSLEESRKVLLQRGEALPLMVLINGRPVRWSALSHPPKPEPKALLVSLRETAEAADVEVVFDAKTGIAIFLGSKVEGQVKAGASEVVINDKTVRLSTASSVVGGQLMVPLDFVVEHWHAKDVRWNEATKMLDVILPTYPPKR
ncbi:MAG: copper amine oxidase N-terminal domain-containing protein [Abditibacteriales bacterium]|nr:copper amine oxidase N-terminal domain-containing protein [Abditibacteriales bacterium]MDW8364692.1 copper amine oxidase N-terminal domain-containing protein [Abditibacteriales bacterium]